MNRALKVFIKTQKRKKKNEYTEQIQDFVHKEWLKDLERNPGRPQYYRGEPVINQSINMSEDEWKKYRENVEIAAQVPPGMIFGLLAGRKIENKI